MQEDRLYDIKVNKKRNNYICAMKYFWAIFSIYIFVLSTMPCGDEKNCNEFSETHTSIVSDNSQNNSHQEEDCSPFCICSCCGCQGFNVAPFPIVIITFSQSDEKKVTPYQSQFLSNYIANIWQPPKIA
jgi:hypothetical protein